MKKISLVFLTIICSIGVTDALGHKPIQSDGQNIAINNALKIPDHKISWVIYEDLKPNQSKYYSFEARENDSFYSSIVVPKIQELENYKPKLSIAKLDDKVKDNFSSNVNFEWIKEFNYEGDIPSSEFYEPFTQTEYWERQEVKMKIPQDGRYYLIVSDMNQMQGKYGLAVGTIEDFTAIDFVTTLPAAWFGTKLFFNDYLSFSLSVLALIAIILVSAWLVKKRMK